MSNIERVGELQGRVSRAKLAQLREAERERDDLLRVRKEWESEHGRLSRQLAGAVDALEHLADEDFPSLECAAEYARQALKRLSLQGGR